MGMLANKQGGAPETPRCAIANTYKPVKVRRDDGVAKYWTVEPRKVRTLRA